MARNLDVYFRSTRCGVLTQDDGGQLEFQYLESWLTHERMPLSQSLPLRSSPFTKKECAGFFGGILPEQSQRDLIADNLGISKKNDFAMLELIGGECAGVLSFLTPDTPYPVNDDRYLTLTSAELSSTLRQLPNRPLLAGDDGIRMSLAGAQTKLAVRVEGQSILIPLGGAPSTHILKPANENFPNIVQNESFCMRLAQSVGFNVAETEVRQVDGIDYLLVARYDRAQEGEGQVSRLHQEDFCQALGVVSELKYQNEGGPSLKQCFDLLRTVSSAPVVDLQALLNATIFNFLIGNHDSHGKNFSLLYANGQTRLAPLYDLISTACYPNLSKKMAMKIGGEYNSDKVYTRNFDQLASEAGLSVSLARLRLRDVTEKVLAALPRFEDEPGFTEIVRERCDRTLHRLNFEPGS